MKLKHETFVDNEAIKGANQTQFNINPYWKQIHIIRLHLLQIQADP